MAKFISILIVAFLVFLAGCIKNSTTDNYDNMEEIFKKAIETKNKTICGKALGFSNRCYNQLARIENRPDECKPILSSEPTKGTCHYAPGDFTPNYCSIYIKYGGYEEDYGACIAEASDYNVKLCTQLNDMKQQELCLVTVYLKKENLTDPEVCPLLEEKNRQDDCKLIIIKNSCDANQSDCKVRRCLDLGFSDISSLDLCKQRTAKTTCKNDTKQCSVDLCEELNLSNQKELERCEEMVFRSIDKN